MLRRGSKSAKKEAAKPAKAAKPAPSKPKKVGLALPPAKSDVFTVMLGIAALALLIGIVFLCLELNRYQWDLKGNKATGRATPTMSGPIRV